MHRHRHRYFSCRLLDDINRQHTHTHLAYVFDLTLAIVYTLHIHIKLYIHIYIYICIYICIYLYIQILILGYTQAKHLHVYMWQGLFGIYIYMCISVFIYEYNTIECIYAQDKPVAVKVIDCRRWRRVNWSCWYDLQYPHLYTLDTGHWKLVYGWYCYQIQLNMKWYRSQLFGFFCGESLPQGLR